MNRSCVWTETEESWETNCGASFVMIEGTPKENNLRFCCYCGRPLEERRTEELEWEEDDGEEAQG